MKDFAKLGVPETPSLKDFKSLSKFLSGIAYAGLILWARSWFQWFLSEV